MKEYNKLYINGEWREGHGEEQYNYNPYDGELLYSYKSATKEDVDDAFEAAKEAQLFWNEISPEQRRQHLKKLIPVLEKMQDEIQECTLKEGGKVLSIGLREHAGCMAALENSLNYTSMLEGTLYQSFKFPGKDVLSYKDAKGVIGIVSPWNMPLALSTRLLFPALACGNTVVLKPSSDTPAIALLLAEAFDASGFPKGVFNVIVGKGSEIGDYFISHPIPAMHAFTGSSPVGRHIAELAGKELKDVALELGGNNVMIVLSDADIERATDSAIIGKFTNSGQICMAINRFLVMDDVHDKFLEALLPKIKGLTVGNPELQGTVIGPLINAKQVSEVEKLIKETIDCGANVALEGKTEGNVIYPWVFTEVTNDMPIASSEVFGPIASIIRVNSEEDAVRLANDTEFGLSGCLWTDDVYSGMQIAKKIKTGNMHINDQPIFSESHIPFGGEKASGMGRTGGRRFVDAFTTEKTITFQK